MTSKLKTKLAQTFGRYRDEEDANLTVEAMIMLPVILWAFMAMFIFFDNFRSHSVAQKAAYTIGDMMSRETDFITPDYLDGAKNLLELLSEADAADTAMRVTVIKYNAGQNKYQRVWTQRRGTGFNDMSNNDVKKLANKLPNMVNNEQLILVETITRYDSIADIGLLDDTVSTFVFTRPRFAPQILWQS